MSRSLLVLAIVWILLLPAVGQTPIDTSSAKWSISSGGNDHVYKAILLPNAITWGEANTAAKLEGGYLATITSAAENEFIFNLVSNDKRYWHYEQWGNTGPWMGGYRKSSNEWGWVTGEPFTYANWFPGEPNNWGGFNDKIAFLGRDHETGPQWDDVSSTSAAEKIGLFWKLNSYIVEFDAPTIIKPSTLENGGIYKFKCLGHIEGNRWLDGVTQENRVWLAPTTTGGYTGTSWQAIEVEPGVYKFKCLGHIEGNRWLDGVTQENRVWLAPATTGGYTGTSWQAIKVG